MFSSLCQIWNRRLETIGALLYIRHSLKAGSTLSRLVGVQMMHQWNLYVLAEERHKNNFTLLL